MSERRGKYNARITELDGVTFDSAAEARRYQELKLLEQAGKIRIIELHPRFMLQEGFTDRGKKYRPITYIADFMYFDIDADGVIVEDVKGKRTEVFNIKMKMFIKRYPHYEFRMVK